MPLDAGMGLTIGERTRLLRLERAYTLEKLAGLAKIKVDTLTRLEADKSKPRLQTIEKIASALKVEVEVLTAGHWTPRSGNGMIDGHVIFPPGAPYDATADLEGDDTQPFPSVEHMVRELAAYFARIAPMMNRREMMQAIAGLGLTGTAGPASALPSIQYGLEGRKVGREVAEWARNQIAFFNDLDVRFGGEQLYPIARSNLGLLQSLLHMRAASGDDERELRLAIAHAASQVGWFAEDIERIDEARQHHHFALEMARSAGGHDFAVYSLTRLAATSLAKGEPSQCLSRLEVAEAEAGPDSPWRSFIQMFAIEAHGQLGNATAAQRTLAQADALHDRTTPVPLPEWAYWIRRPSSSAIAARSFISHDPKFAVRLFEGALATAPTNFLNSRLHYMAGLARAKQNLGELEEALDNADKVLHSVLDSPVPRVEKSLAEFHAKLPDDPVSKPFKERFADYTRLRKASKLHS